MRGKVSRMRKALIAARARGRSAKNQEPGGPVAPNGPQHGSRRKRGASPFLVAGVAFAAGTVLAKLVDWRGHAHPKR